MTATVVNTTQPIHPAGCNCTDRLHARAERATLCGTYAGYKRHQKVKSAVCEPCREAKADYARAARAANPKPKPAPPAKPVNCGTMPGYRRHQKHKEPVCDPCRQAMRAQSRARHRGQDIRQTSPQWVLIEQAIARGGLLYAVDTCGYPTDHVQKVWDAMKEAVAS